MGLRSHHIACFLVVGSLMLSSTAATVSGPPATSGTTDPAVINTIVPPADWDDTAPALEVPGPARGRYRRDGSLVAVTASIPRSSSSSSRDPPGPRPASAMTADRLDNNVCMVVQSTGPEMTCKVSPNGRFRFCLQRDANIVLYDGPASAATPYWASNTQGRTSRLPLRLCMQADGNLVAYDSANTAFWASNTCCRGRRTPITAFIQNDGNFVVYDAACTAVWATNTLRTTSVAPACSAAGSTQRVPLTQTTQVTGPFGGGNPANNPAAFDDAAFANNGANMIRQIDVRAGSWIDAIRFTYGSTTTPWRGGNGGGVRPAFTLATNEWITQAWVRSGGFVDEIRFFTNTGRYWSTSGDTTQSGDMGSLASPCPSNAYRLISIKGVGGGYLERIEFVWTLASGATGPLVSTVNQWSYLPGDSPVFRLASTNQPQCLSRDGRTCATSRDAYSLRMCADTLSTRPVTCAATDGANDPLHWCNKARGALGLAVAPVPIRIAFFNVEVCNSGLAVADSAAITVTLYSDPHSLKNYWRQASNNRAFMDETTSAVINLRLPCDRFPINSCDVGSWVDYARDNPSALGGRVFSQYQFQTFIAPRTAACDAQGIGFAYGSASWIRADFINDLNIFKHEIGHNFGLPHSGRIIPPADVQGYGDDTTPMGYCAKCIYNAVEQLRLGWSRALPVVEWTMFSGSTTLTLPALSDTAAFRDLGVVQICLATPSDPGVPGGVTSHIYVSYRVTKNQDANLPAKYSSATSVHGFNGDTWLLAWPKTGQAYVNTANKMVVRQDSGDSNQARVTLCKWASSQNECGVFNTFVRTSIGTSISTASAEAPVDRDAYYGKHTWEPAGLNTTAGVVGNVPVALSGDIADAAELPATAVMEAASTVPMRDAGAAAAPADGAEATAVDQP